MGNREEQRFRRIAPLVPIPKLTRGQCLLLDEVDWRGLSWKNRNRCLRELVRLGVVRWEGMGRYRVTKLGRVARGLGVRR